VSIGFSGTQFRFSGGVGLSYTMPGFMIRVAQNRKLTCGWNSDNRFFLATPGGEAGHTWTGQEMRRGRGYMLPSAGASKGGSWGGGYVHLWNFTSCT